MVDWGWNYDFQEYFAWQNDSDRVYGGFYDTISGISPSYNIYPAGKRLPNGYGVGEEFFLNAWYKDMNPDDAGSVFLGSARVTRSCMGQRSTYQAEDNAEMIKQFPGYGYEETDMVNADWTDDWKGSQRVKRCLIGIQKPGYVAKKLYENNEQSDVISRRELPFMYSDQKRTGDNFRWYIKPRMRIDADFANQPVNRNKNVALIQVYNYAGRLFFYDTIKVSDFLDNDLKYNGDYIEDFIDKTTGEYKLSVLSDSLVAGADSAEYYSNKWRSKVDYRVYWFGEADLWLDYIRVDDEWAHYLFTDPYGDKNPFSVNPYRFASRIRDEIANLKKLKGFAMFYQDEFYWNNIPCIAETNRLIKEMDPETGIVVMTSHSPGLKNTPPSEVLYSRLKNEGLYNDFILIDRYPIYENTFLPSNITLSDSVKRKYNAVKYYRSALNNRDYNRYLNDSVYEHVSTFLDYKEAAKIIKSSGKNTSLISTVQTHTVESNIARILCDSVIRQEFRREPTNEEISLQAFFSLCYGAHQIHYFQQFSWKESRKCNNITENYYDWGINGLEVNSSGHQGPRVYNYYGQKKYDFLASLDTVLMKTGKYMYDEKGLKFNAAVSVHKDGFREGYIKDLRSFYRNAGEPYEFNEMNEDTVKYWQIGYFVPPGNNNDKYFILLNMSCTPEIKGGDGDKKKVKIYLDEADLARFDKWKLVNPITNEVVIFSNTVLTSGIIVPGIFNPGEGKLFRLLPAD